jgi:hypothetical protein
MEIENQNSLWTVRLNIKAEVSSKYVLLISLGKIRALKIYFLS